ncbi:unnamed protein product [Brassica oleracea]
MYCNLSILIQNHWPIRYCDLGFVTHHKWLIICLFLWLNLPSLCEGKLLRLCAVSQDVLVASVSSSLLILVLQKESPWRKHHRWPHDTKIIKPSFNFIFLHIKLSGNNHFYRLRQRRLCLEMIRLFDFQ